MFQWESVSAKFVRKLNLTFLDMSTKKKIFLMNIAGQFAFAYSYVAGVHATEMDRSLNSLDLDTSTSWDLCGGEVRHDWWIAELPHLSISVI